MILVFERSLVSIAVEFAGEKVPLGDPNTIR